MRTSDRVVGASRRTTTVALVATILVIAALTLSPRSGSSDVELHPLRDFNTTDAVENLLLFLPFGATLSLRRWPLLRATAAGIAFSASVELAQLVIPGRTTSVDDLVFNTLGTGLGWAIAAMFKEWGSGL